MLIKVYNKGQVVIPSEIRKRLGISIGDMLDLHINEKNKTLEVRKPQNKADKIAGSLHKYAKGKPFPSKSEMRNILSKGLTGKNEG